MLRFSILTVLLCGVALPALAQDQASDAAPGEPPAEGVRIVVTAQRPITAALRDVPVERDYDADRVASYAVSTVGEVLDEIAAENGDDAPALLVNGEPVSGREDIEDYPAEAIARIEVLPPGSATRIGGTPGERVYNVILRDSVTTATATIGHRLATEGGWNSEQAELLLTHIRGQDRANVTLRGRDSGMLLEAQRGVIQPLPSLAFAPLGNVLPYPLGALELDPALSALAGVPVTAAGVPAGQPSPTLADFAAGANRVNAVDLGQFRSLRSANRGYELGFAGSKRLAPWLTASLNGNLDWSQDHGLSGLPGALFLVPEAHPASPFSRDVLLALSDEDRPLKSRSKVDNSDATLMLSGRFGDWNARLTGRLLRRDRTYSYERSAQSATAPIALGPDRKPFAPSLADEIPVATELTRTRIATDGVRADIDGPLFELPAGSVTLRAGAGIDWTRLTATASSGAVSDQSRSVTTLQAGLSVPIASARNDVLAFLGEFSASADVLRIELSDQGTLWHWSSELSWRLRPWVRLNAGFNRTRRPPEVEQLSGPVITYPNVRILDPVTEETVDVTVIGGGNPALRAETVYVTRVSVGVAPLPKYNLQLQADYVATSSRNPIGALPPTSSAVAAAFPARYQRDPGGRLIAVDSRAVNFLAQDQDQVRYSASFLVPLYPVATGPDASGAAAGPRPRLEASLAHTILLSNRLQIAAGLPAIDLLREGASGLGGSRPQHLIDGSVALSDRGTGLRLSGSWRSASSLVAGTALDPQRIRFGSLALFDLRVFAEASRLLPASGWAKGARVSVVVQNIANARQPVTDSRAVTPLSYQPAYRDPLGRTITFELRKAF